MLVFWRWADGSAPLSVGPKPGPSRRASRDWTVFFFLSVFFPRVVNCPLGRAARWRTAHWLLFFCPKKGYCFFFMHAT